MTEQEALDVMREHLTNLYAKSDIYEDGTHNIICALEEHVIPSLERKIKIDALVQKVFNLPDEVWARVNAVSPDELRAAGFKYEHDGSPFAKVKKVDLDNGIIELKK